MDGEGLDSNCGSHAIAGEGFDIPGLLKFLFLDPRILF